MSKELFGALAVLVLAGETKALPITSGAITLVSPPSSVERDATVSSNEIILFAERQSLVLPQAVAVDVTSPTTVTKGLVGATPGTIPVGTAVDVHFLHHDSPGSSIITLSGSIAFDMDILGVVLSDSGLDSTDSFLGLSILYPTGLENRGTAALTNEAGDRFTLAPDQRTLTIRSSVGGINDQLRVITATTPEPATAILFGLGLTLLYIERNRSRSWIRDAETSPT